ncbi:hypothetical protein [Roseimaritima sediminicola]|uniref:hypothetical protein n=1 Tax=Roseimaritima sediminicola TaxID=2662066 RepID=UPI0012982949|nr:hypothetical protein [Roseimaritima sediminicola]
MDDLCGFNVADWFKRRIGRGGHRLHQVSFANGTGALRKLVSVRLLSIDPMPQAGDSRILGAVVASITVAMAVTADNNADHRRTASHVHKWKIKSPSPGEGYRYYRLCSAARSIRRSVMGSFCVFC